MSLQLFKEKNAIIFYIFTFFTFKTTNQTEMYLVMINCATTVPLMLSFIRVKM